MISDGVYTFLKETSVDNVKEIINSILALTGSDTKWNDYFEIYEDFDEEFATWCYDNVYDTEITPTREELLNFVHSYNKEHFDKDDSICTWLAIKPLMDEVDDAAELLDRLNFLFNINYENPY